MREIGELLALRIAPGTTCGQIKRRTEAKVADIEDRIRTLRRMKRALEAMVIEGIKTTVPLHLKIMDDPRFRAGDIGTDFMEYFLSRNGRKVAAS